MDFRSLWVGCLAAVLVALPALVRALLPEGPWRWAWMPLLGVALIGGVQSFARRTKKGRALEGSSPGTEGGAPLGLADLLLSIHRWKPSQTTSIFRRRAGLSFFFSLFGGTAGVEGVAVEGGYSVLSSIRPADARWIEFRRRTDAGLALAAGVAASFHAPWAAVLLVFESGVGGSPLPILTGALVASWLAGEILSWVPLAHIGSETMEIAPLFIKFSLKSPSLWFAMATLGAILGLVGSRVGKMGEFLDRQFDRATGGRPLARLWLGAAGLTLTFIAVPPLMSSQGVLLEQLLWGRDALGEAGVWLLGSLFVCIWLSMGLGLGGLLWPTFFVGCLSVWVLIAQLPPAWMAGLGSEEELLPILVLGGGVALWSSVLGAPFSAAILGSEIARQPALLPFFGGAALIAYAVASRLAGESELGWYQTVRRAGLRILGGGRDEAVLSRIPVKAALDRNLQIVHENDPLQLLKKKLEESVHPFLAVVDKQGLYLGLIAMDQILAADAASRTLEARELLGLSGSPRSGAVREDEPLSLLSGRFSDSACIPVVDVESRPVGLVFAHRFRSAYEGALERQSLREDR
jgi:H+/Cl- antiporter ClcA